LIKLIHSNEEELALIDCINNDELMLDLCMNVYGCHIIQKIISYVRIKIRENLINFILKNLNLLIYDSNGMCVIKMLLIVDVNSIKVKTLTYDFICANFLLVSKNQYGNYIVQLIFEIWGLNQICLLNIIKQNIIKLSIDKFSCNIVERLLEITDDNLKLEMIKEIFMNNRAHKLVSNKYGMMIMQSAKRFITMKIKYEIVYNIKKKLLRGNFTEMEKVNFIMIIQLLS
jgi:hypothetical protein